MDALIPGAHTAGGAGGRRKGRGQKAQGSGWSQHEWALLSAPPVPLCSLPGMSVRVFERTRKTGGQGKFPGHARGGD